MNCNKDIIGISCRCRECNPRSEAQLKGDKVQGWRKWKRAKMERLPEFIKDYRLEVVIDPIIDEIEGENFMSEIPIKEYLPYSRGDCMPDDEWGSIHKVNTKSKK